MLLLTYRNAKNRRQKNRPSSLPARRPDPGRFPAGLAARHQCSSGLGRARGAPFWPLPFGARASPIPGWHFRTLLQRRLRPPLSCGPSRCRCGLALDPYGDHRAARATTGVLPARAAPIERAVARICREGGAPVAVNVPFSRMNLSVPPVRSKSSQMICRSHTWLSWQWTPSSLVSPLGRTGTTRLRRDPAHPSQRKREQTYPEFSCSRRCHLVILGPK